jgi:hypothetical protein
MATEMPQDQSDVAAFSELLMDSGAYTRPQARKQEQPGYEQSMHAMRRILGDEVLELFPEGFTDQVDKLFKVHSANPALWAEISCDSEDDRDDLFALMRAYAECADDPGYTIRQDRTTGASVLRVRVITRKGSAKTDDGGAAE